MPKMNGSGPDGKGPKTGRGLGNCSKKSSVDITKLGIGQGKRRRAENISGEKSNRLRFFKF
jgi:hypothetical protein